MINTLFMIKIIKLLFKHRIITNSVYNNQKQFFQSYSSINILSSIHNFQTNWASTLKLEFIKILSASDCVNCSSLIFVNQIKRSIKLFIVSCDKTFSKWMALFETGTVAFTVLDAVLVLFIKDIICE